MTRCCICGPAVLLVAVAVFMCPAFPAGAASASETIVPGDVVYVDVYRQPQLSGSAQVDPEGNIDLPYIGLVGVGNKTTRDAAATVSAALRKYLRNPRVTVRHGLPPTDMSGSARTEQMVTEIIELENSGAETISNALQGMSTEGGAIGFDPNTNALIITDTPATIENIKAAITRLDRMQSQRTQVRIAGKLAEVRVGAMKDIGVRWWVQGDHAGGGYYPMPNQNPRIGALRGPAASPLYNEQIGATGTADNNVSGSGMGRRFVNQGVGSSGTEGRFDRRLNVPVQIPRLGEMFFGYMNLGIDVGAMLDALVADDKAEILAEPASLAVNHRSTTIQMVDKFPYTQFSTTTYSGRGITSTEFMDIGITMEVTPHVYNDEGGAYVQLDLHPEVSFANGAANNVPIRATRSWDGTANVRDGQTLAIGGIYNSSLHTVDQRVPVIGRVPIVGNLFKHKENAKDQTELLIFVTPTVYESPETITWERVLGLAKESELVVPAIPPAQVPRETGRE